MSAPSQSAVQAEAEARLRFEMLLADVCAGFVDLAPADLDSKIENAQSVICEALGLDHSSVWQVSEGDPDAFVMTHTYRDPTLRALPSRAALKDYFPWSLRKILAKEIVYIPKTDHVPAEAATDQQSWLQYDIRSALAFPLFVGGRAIGLLTFDSTKERDWPQSLQRRLQILALVFAQVLDRKRSEEKVRESETRFRLVADTAPVLIWMSGIDKLCTYFNKPWLDFTGRSIEQEIGNGWVEGVHVDDVLRCLDTYSRAFDRHQEFKMEYRLRRHDGEYRWILDRGVPRFTQDHSFVGYIGSCVDVTDFKEVQEKLRETAEKFRRIFEEAGVGMVIVSPEGRYLAANRTFCDYLGYTEQELLARTVESVTLPDDWPAFSRKLQDALAQRLGFQWLEKRCLHKSGRIVYTESSTSVIRDEKGEPQYFIGQVLDVTRRKEAEEAVSGMSRKLLEAQEQERARIARELHDDITQRLAMLVFGLDHVLTNPSTFESRLQELRKEAVDLSDDVQTLSHELHSSMLEILGVVKGIESWCIEFGDRQNMLIDFKSDLESALPLELGICLLRVLQEALHNAAKHSGEKRADVQLLERGNEAHLIIADSGQGFDIEAARQGRGLGLTSMQERVRLVNGTIEIQSKPMVGTIIHVRVPFRSQDQGKNAAA